MIKRSGGEEDTALGEIDGAQERRRGVRLERDRAFGKRPFDAFRAARGA